MVINYNITDLTLSLRYLSLLLLCNNYDNLAFLLGEFSDFSSAAGSILECEFRVNYGLEAAA